MPKKISDHDLLTRIDERQAGIIDKLREICGSLNKKVDKDDEYLELKKRVDNLWDSKNRMIGWMLGAGASGGLVAGILRALVSDVIAKIQ